MKLRFLLIYLFILIAAGITGCYIILNGSLAEDIPVHTTGINRLLVRLGNEWNEVSSYNDRLTVTGEDFDYCIIDNDGNVLLYTRDDIAKNISKATSDYDIIRDIESDGDIVGKLIVHNPKNEIQKQTNMKIAVFVSVLLLVTVIVFISYYFYLKRNIVDPFRKLNSFAVKIAGGNLDTPLEMDKGNVFGAFTESFDIMREELKASREREEKAVKSRKELVAQLSHDIKTPVASIKAMTDVMSLTAKDEEEKKTITAISNKADQIDALISNLFHATLEELEQLEVKPGDIDSTEIVQMIREADYLNKVSELKIRDVVVSADRLRLNQVISNIIFNSYKYAGTDISVNGRFDPDGKFLLIEIADKGPGVPEDELELITQKFKRGSNAAGKDGSGLGLYISDYLMRKMEGSLTPKNTSDGFAVVIGIKIA
ncbi:MAG: HAMP domain-containing histidine kinase [Saccharofermentans sp.]|nr:HAMP domain-containing histidine kinase [Saccharofermentans sp.]